MSYLLPQLATSKNGKKQSGHGNYVLSTLSGNYIITVPLKGNIALARIFSRVNWSTRGEQKVEQMASQANNL